MLGAAWLGLVTLAAGCGSSRAPERLPLAVVPPERPRATCEHDLPGGVGGFDLGRDGSIGAAGLRCQREGYEWTPMDDGGTCSETPMRVLYQASARILSCGSHVCAIQIRYEFGGETAMRTGITRLWQELQEQYGEAEWVEDEVRPCPRVEGDMFGCVLDGIGIVQYRWHVADPDDHAATCESPTGIIALRADGDRGTHDGRVTVTYVTAEAVSDFEAGGAEGL